MQSQHKFSLPTGIITTQELSTDGTQLFAACMDGVYQVPLIEGGEPQRIYNHDSYVSGVHVDPQRAVVISAGYDGQLIWYDLERQSIFRRVLANQFWSWQPCRSIA